MGRMGLDLPIHAMADAAGRKAFGEGEWTVRQPGIGKRRTWLKFPLAAADPAAAVA